MTHVFSKARVFGVLSAALALSACGGGGGNSPSTNASDNSTGTGPGVTVATCAGTEINPERLFLQQVGADRAIIKWRGDADGGAGATKICFGTDINALPLSSETDATVTATSHSEVLLTGLTPDTLYYYSIGGAGQGVATRSFRTAPLAGESPADGNVRIWVLGDSGTQGSSIQPSSGATAADVRDAYKDWIVQSGNNEPTDMILMLGDSAYLDGNDAQFQASVFETYPDLLSTSGMWGTIGNHEMGSSGVSTSPVATTYSTAGVPEADGSRLPYLNIHTLPTQGENGGEPSGTEQYYSFDYGNVHVVSLDSQLTMRDATANQAMKDWLIADLSANNSDWTIVIFHHPPYTKGSHDSDANTGSVEIPGVGTITNAQINAPIFEIRENYTPIFEQYGVDLTYAGHSHVYERSFYLKGHTGLSDSFDAATHAELNGNGDAANGQGAEAYQQLSPTSGGIDDRVVYTTAGSSGQSPSRAGDWPHEAISSFHQILGSVVIDATQTELTARFIDATGTEQDHVVIQK